MNNEQHFQRLAEIYLAAPCNRIYEPEISVELGRATIRFQAKADFLQGLGTVHGSVYFKALDDAAYFAANSQVKDNFLVTVSYNIYFTRPISAGE